MKRTVGRVILLTVLVALVFYLLHYRQMMLPPLGKFLNPFVGLYQNGDRIDQIPEEITVDGLIAPVTIHWDNRRVAHLRAENDHDLFLAQGYVTARDRLWQMEFQVMAAGGRLSEIIGPQLLEYDRFRRRTGMRFGARQALDSMMATPETKAALEAYAQGVNAYVAELGPEDYPLEYKLLDYAPEPWTPLKSAILLKHMAWGLTAYNNREVAMSAAYAELGDSLFEKLYPNVPPFLEPIVPAGVYRDAKSQVPPGPESLFVPNFKEPKQPETPPELGSNNWAVSAEKTANGIPILCNDPHLGLQLPSVWYEIQLTSPTMNVYGVTLPGAPTVVIGFNEHAAWGVTNGETDVLDLYQIKFTDSADTAYLFEGETRSVERIIDTIYVRGIGPVPDTTYWTHQGPVVYRTTERSSTEWVRPGLALAWTGHRPTNELLAFLRLNRAASFEDFDEAVRHLDCPGQNVIFATRDDIAIRHAGLLPIRWRGQGRLVSDGASSKYDWTGWIPKSDLPMVRNPESGFVSSSNQFPVTPEYPYYISGNHAPTTRAKRISALLSESDKVTPEQMIAMQSDAFFEGARIVLPLMLEAVNRAEITDGQQPFVDSLSNWNYVYAADAHAPSYFESWWRHLADSIWALYPNSENLQRPRADVFQLAMVDNDHPLVGHLHTADDSVWTGLVTESFVEAVNDLRQQAGTDDTSLEWGNYQGTYIQHVARFPGLGGGRQKVSGRGGAINANALGVGPSWRMVVELSNPPRAWGVYPGGQSGHAGSAHYTQGVQDWVDGNSHELNFVTPENDFDNAMIGTTTMRSEP